MKEYKKYTSEEDYKKGLTSRESFLVSTLAREDKKIFGIEDVRSIIGKDPKRVMSSLLRKKWILSLKRGLYAVVPLDVGVKGADSFILHNFVIASHLVDPYYIGYWSALNYYGLTEQLPRTTFIATTKPKSSLIILQANYYFIKIKKRKFFGFEEIEVDGWKVNISSPEKSIVDCLDHPEHCGGIDETARSIYFNHDELDLKRIYSFSEVMDNKTILKRLGYILETSGLFARYRNLFTGFKPSKGYPALDPLCSRKGRHNSRWGLLVNVDLKPEGWMY